MKAIVLCAGWGTRLGDLTKNLPKPLLPIHDRPLLDYILSWLASQGIAEIALNLHHCSEMILDYCGEGRKWGVSLHYSYEEFPLGTAGAVKKLEPWLKGSENFLVVYGDILTDQPLKGFMLFHRQKKGLASLLLHKRSGSNSVVEMDSSNHITLFQERPTKSVQKEHWVNSGIQILSEEVLDLIPADEITDLPRDIYSKYHKQKRIYGYPLTGNRVAIDSQERYRFACRDVAAGVFNFNGE